MEFYIGRVTHYYNRIGVAVCRLAGELTLGDTILILGATTDLTQPVTSMEINHKKVQSVPAGTEVALKVVEPVRAGDSVFRIAEQKLSKTGKVRIDRVPVAKEWLGGKGILVLQPCAPLDCTNYEDLVETARAGLGDHPGPVIVDLDGIDEICLSGYISLYLVGLLTEGDPRIKSLLQTTPLGELEGWGLIRGLCQAIEKGRPFTHLYVVTHSEKVLSLLQLTRLTTLIRTVPSVAEASRRLAAATLAPAR